MVDRVTKKQVDAVLQRGWYVAGHPYDAPSLHRVADNGVAGQLRTACGMRISSAFEARAVGKQGLRRCGRCGKKPCLSGSFPTGPDTVRLRG